jgi:N-acetylmuramoyl-L-alanine amidase
MTIFRLIYLIFIFFATISVHASSLTIRTADRSERTARIVFDIAEKQDISYKSDLQSLSITLNPISSPIIIKNQSRQIQSIHKKFGDLHLIFSFNFTKDFIIHNVFWIPPSSHHSLYRYVIDLKEKTDVVPSSSFSIQVLQKKKKIIIDPGHGGKDPGTIGIKKIYEKNITLTVAKRLAQKLAETGRYTPVLLRMTDVSMTLAQRLKNARSARGDLFISLHADSCEGNDTRGLSIYTLSAVASDRQAERLAKKENKADLIIGVDLQSELPEVANILIDLTKRETMNLSTKFAQCLMNKLRDRVFLLRKPHRFADFFILKSADLPSVLIELGYLSNPKEAILLTNTNHQEVICEGIVDAIDTFFKIHP